jgi:hypothetical protein
MNKPTGYADTSLVNKLGFAAGDTIYVEDTPDWYSEFANKNDLELTPGLPATHSHLFCENKATLEAFLKNNDLDDIEKSFWVSWPKQSSCIKANINDRSFRDMILPLGWVDTKVVAIDETWSGLKFLRRRH